MVVIQFKGGIHNGIILFRAHRTQLCTKLLCLRHNVQNDMGADAMSWTGVPDMKEFTQRM